MPDPSDRDLALSAARGDADAFGELVRRYQTPVFNVCYRLMGERAEAEDMAQEAFLRAYERLGSYDAGRPFGPWVRRVAANVCLNRLARARPALVAFEDEWDEPPAPPRHNPEAARQEAEAGEALRAAIQSLPPQYRAVIELRHFQELSYEEIAAALDVPLNTAKSYLFRARKLLAQRLGQDG
jgi:RNA polymerase sigma-70 factor (ECF subfamily)